MDGPNPSLTAGQVLAVLPLWLRQQLLDLNRASDGTMYLTGGVVRDLLRGTVPADIDITIPRGALVFARRLAERTHGAFVPLGRGEDAARVVCRKTVVDISAFRQGAGTIAEELSRRDLTINALAVQLDILLGYGQESNQEKVDLVDPTGGIADLKQGLIRLAGPASFVEDPLRMLRVFRFAATLDFRIDDRTLNEVARQKDRITRVAPERIAYELDLIMASPRAYAALATMVDTGLLWAIIPELKAGQGMHQPLSHHLDVLGHSLETLRQMEQLQQEPHRYFPDAAGQMASLFADTRYRRRLNWAALLHDLGKPVTHAVREDKGGRITFYNHDNVGAALFRRFASRLHWSNEETDRVALLISNHMRPFHLANEARKGSLTLRACVRMVRRMQRDLPGLLCLSMADALAGQGPNSISTMKNELAGLYARLEQVLEEHVAPVQSAAPLINGHDLIELFQLEPGPLFREVLSALNEAQMEDLVHGRQEALQWVAAYIEQRAKQRGKDKE